MSYSILDSFPLQRIDQMVNATASHELLSFMDTYSGYNKIKMHPPNEDKRAFITDREVYYYKVIPFRLKNAGATFQRIINKIFKELIEHTMKVYVDDILVKSLQNTNHVQHLCEAFDHLQKYRVRLNPKKCTFELVSEKFLG